MGITFKKNDRGLGLLQILNLGVTNKAFRSSFFIRLEVICEIYEAREFKQAVTINWAYKYDIVVYQMAKLQMLEFYYDFLDRSISRKDLRLCFIDTDSLYLATSGYSLN